MREVKLKRQVPTRRQLIDFLKAEKLSITEEGMLYQA